MHRRLLVTLALLMCALGPAPANVGFAQSASVTGVVSTGREGLPGVTVTVIPESGGIPKQTTSGADGSYRFDGLPDGTYRVDFELPVFELVRRNHVHVRRGAAATVDAILAVRPLCECITIPPPSPWTLRPGQVIDQAGRPLPHARVELVGREAMRTDDQGRFLVQLPVEDSWPLAASDTGFRGITQHESGADSASVVLALEFVGTAGVPDYERFGGCECPGNLLPFKTRE